VVLTSSAGSGNQWYDGGVLIAGQTATTYTAATAGNYTVMSTQGGCSSAASSATSVTVNTAPTTPSISAGGSTTFCAGGSVVLTSNAGSGNQWYDGGVLISGQTSPTYSASTAGNYSVISTQSGCSSAASTATSVTVNTAPATPSISSGGSTTFCAGGSVLLTSSAAGGNQWYADGVLIVGQTATTYTAATAGNYTVISTQSGCSSAASTATSVTVNTAPATPSISSEGSTSFCAGGSVLLTSSAAGGNQWYADGVLIAGQTATTYTAATAGNYTVMSTQSGCSSAASTATSVTVNAIPATPIISAGGATTFCTGGSVLLTSSAAGGNQWYADGVLIVGQTATTYTAATAGNYTVITTNGNCVSPESSQITITVNPLPTQPTTFLESTTAVCQSQSNVTYSIANDPTVTYNWSYSGSGASLTANANTLSVAFSNTATNGNISVTANNTCGTSSALTIPVTVYDVPNANFDLPVVCLPLGKAIFKNTSTISDGTQNLFSYLWNFNDPSDPTASTSINPTHYFSGTGPYDIQLTVTSINGCKQTISKILNTITQGPVSGFSASSLKACVNDQISFTDQSTDISSTPNNWYWDFGNGNTSSLQNPSEQYVDSGSFNISLYVSNLNGCVSDTVTKQLMVYPYPKLILNSPVMVHPNSAVQLIPQYYEGSNLSFLWSPSLYLDSPQIINPVCTPLNDITYTLTITNYGTCSTSDQLSVLLLNMPVIPNAFSPNGDGINDTWVIKYLDRYPKALVSIFDRDGQLLYYTENFTSWDGKYKNQPLPIGTYYYIINLNDGSPILNGSITIIR
jgi:gliding motility-associated-like protein